MLKEAEELANTWLKKRDSRFFIIPHTTYKISPPFPNSPPLLPPFSSLLKPYINPPQIYYVAATFAARGHQTMADFVQKAAVKSAVRKLASPIESISAFTTLVQDILTDNPWGCTSYVSAGATIAPVVKGAESYTGNVIYEDAPAKTVGRITVRAPTQAAFNTDIITILADSTIRTAMGGSPSHDS
jgi:hypothetical protein